MDLISNLPPPKTVREVRSFLGHAGFYSKVSRPLCNLLAKDVHFIFDDSCLVAFRKLKQLLISSPIIQPPNWSLPFELMCDASDYVVGAVLGQRVDRIPHVLSHIISSKGIEVDKAKVDLISNLPPPKIVREVRFFLGHAGFYRRFIKDFRKVSRL